MADGFSNIRVFVHWRDQTVFAGEAVQCTPPCSFSQRPSSSPFNASYPPDRFGRIPVPRSPQSSTLSVQRRSSKALASPMPSPMPDFRFPAAPAPDSETVPSPRKASGNSMLSPRTGPVDGNIPIRSKEQLPPVPDRPVLTARILSSTSMAGGTPRSSGEFYSISNNSSETLASEYVAPPLTRGSGRPSYPRRGSAFSPHQSRTESLMMGFAQIQGSFSLDGSLISLAPFEQVKKKAVVGGRGGGVVGLDSGRRENGLLRGFGWGSISNSLGDFLGGGELSTIKEMRGVANSKAVPLLSTPQSILFVDLQLAPGESRSFEYTFKLPKGLPPTHKGKAIKISYSLVIGTQRPGGAREQHVRTVEVPFRVLGSVNSHGEILGHDLMNPYILLRDEALVKMVGKQQKSHAEREASGGSAAMSDFLSYVDSLTNRPGDKTGGSLLSPTATPDLRRLSSSSFEETTSAKEAIRLAIMKSNQTGQGQQSASRFEIARNGQRVGVVMLTRPAYRLGEVVTMVIDFADADIPCYAVHATLESSERIDSSLALRSDSSIHRVTRKVYVASSESTLFTRRVVFTPTIPISATPEFVTSGVSFEWKIRVEFVVPSQGHDASKGQQTPYPLLEQISRDDKGGLVLVAVENLTCESFDVPVPLRVYGAVGTGLERLERDEASEEGLIV
ncbi:Rgp1-domain-containing protein [Trichoderma citrinoviride]|uniref:Rgp1-domain-containing protein n=1 Tax=Trichoderma citrinoviride TaxID=58853 RepID=A0A2T4B4X2_9HYPO|nr:Rgp1-domain-containing protein [Trichoderma citrinoviride]PTB64383.1 Rgp1-domain-containing protein [Trichoderma citrinoviride]